MKYDGKVFISYSWSTPDHERWVLELAKELTQNGIHVELDKWDLREGHDTISFMERMVSSDEITKVIIVCDRQYVEKTDARQGGVGTEAQIISPELYSKQGQDKFVAVIAERDEAGKPYVPVYYKSRMYIDLSQSERYSEEFEKLVRWVYGKPLHVRPEMGVAPSYVVEDSVESTAGTSSLAKRVVDAFRNGKEFRRGALGEYFEAYGDRVSGFRLVNISQPIDELVVSAIESSIHARNEFFNVLDVVFRYNGAADSVVPLRRLFERLVNLYGPAKNVGSFYESEFDASRFLVHELFVGMVALLVREDQLEPLSILLNAPYYFAARLNQGSDKNHFSAIYENTESLDYRVRRLGLGRASLRADFLSNRCEGTSPKFEEMMQADFICWVNTKASQGFWFPETLIYAARHRGAFEIFSRAASPIAMRRLLDVLGVSNITELQQMVEVMGRNGEIPKWGFHSFDMSRLANLEALKKVS